MGTQPNPALPQSAGRDRRSLWVGYALLLAFGSVGAHRFYYGLERTAKAMVVLVALSVPLLLLGGIGIYGLYVVMLWVVLDIFILPLMARDWNLAHPAPAGQNGEQP